jgi:phosphoglycolate phosphatase
VTLPTVSAVLFDLDGTLIDTAPEFMQIGLQLRAEAGLAPIDSETIWHSVSNGAIGMVQAALEMSADDPAFEHWRQRFLTLYETGLGNLSHPYPALPELVADLHKRGGRLGCCHQQTVALCAPTDEQDAL